MFVVIDRNKSVSKCVVIIKFSYKKRQKNSFMLKKLTFHTLIKFYKLSRLKMLFVLFPLKVKHKLISLWTM